ncbi:hypothetical protein ANCCEY_07261 [Ancylostoma ceylanicum]|uniref:Uncharacterized protein n=1 Tax=Ancylostoma ceylanicum TaxID=53326 RepID=A0A0D6LR00_9BILA|nr:hypothetical protein ANCCEY_07261 [Ancylostoma ceylanicum]
MAACVSMSPQEEGELSDRGQQCSSDESELKENRKRKFAETSDASDKEAKRRFVENPSPEPSNSEPGRMSVDSSRDVEPLSNGDENSRSPDRCKNSSDDEAKEWDENKDRKPAKRHQDDSEFRSESRASNKDKANDRRELRKEDVWERSREKQEKEKDRVDRERVRDRGDDDDRVRERSLERRDRREDKHSIREREDRDRRDRERRRSSERRRERSLERHKPYRSSSRSCRDRRDVRRVASYRDRDRDRRRARRSRSTDRRRSDDGKKDDDEVIPDVEWNLEEDSDVEEKKIREQRERRKRLLQQMNRKQEEANVNIYSDDSSDEENALIREARSLVGRAAVGSESPMSSSALSSPDRDNGESTPGDFFADLKEKMVHVKGADEHVVEETLLRGKREEEDDAKREREYHDDKEKSKPVDPQKDVDPPKPSTKSKTEFDMFADDADLPQVELDINQPKVQRINISCSQMSGRTKEYQG